MIQGTMKSEKKKKVFNSAGLVLILVLIQVVTVLKKATDSYHCSTVITKLKFLHFHLNCDSPIFLLDAQHPTRFINGASMYQDRPIYSLINNLLFTFAKQLHLPLHPFAYSGSDEITTTYYLENYAIFILENLLILSFAIFIALSLVSQLHYQSKASEGISKLLSVAVVAILSMNKITHDFFWSPHTQMFNVLLPCILLAVAMNAKWISDKSAILKFVVLSILILSYPLCIILIPLLAISYIKSRSAKQLLWLVASVIPYFSLPILITNLGGKYQNIGTRDYRQFVWILDGIRNHDLVSTSILNFSSYLSTFPKIVLFTVLIYWSYFLYAYFRNSRNTEKFIQRTHLSRVLIGFLTYFLFLYAMGYYSPRLTWGLVLYLMLSTVMHARIYYSHARAFTIIIIFSTCLWVLTWFNPNFPYG